MRTVRDRSVEDLMTSEVVSVRSGASYKEVVAMLAEHHVSAVPVLDIRGVVIGVISETDLLAKEACAGPNRSRVWELISRRGRAARVRAGAVTAGMLMSTPPVTVGPLTSRETAARLMWRHGVNRLPVVDGQGCLIGIVARSDLLTPFLRPDADIHEETLRRLAGTLSIDPQAIGVRVVEGVVTLSGVMPVGTAFQAVDLARQVDGVVEVIDTTRYPDARAPAPREGGDDDS